MTTIGFIGLGAIGWPMAATLAGAGWPVTVHDAEEECARRFAAEHDCLASEDLAKIGACDVVVTVLPNGHVVREVVTVSQDGALVNALRSGALLIDMSSSDPLGTIELGAELKARGVAMVDAPISKRDSVFMGASGRPRAGGTPLPLVLMMGGEADALEKARPVLAAIADTLIVAGPPGSGHVAKTLNNYAAGAAHVALGEAMLAGERFGLKPETFIEIVNQSTGRSFISQVLMQKRTADPSFEAGFSAGLMAKDMGIALRFAEAMNLDAPVARAALDRWNTARDRLGASADVAAVLQAWNDDLT